MKHNTITKNFNKVRRNNQVTQMIIIKKQQRLFYPPEIYFFRETYMNIRLAPTSFPYDQYGDK